MLELKLGGVDKEEWEPEGIEWVDQEWLGGGSAGQNDWAGFPRLQHSEPLK